MITLTHSSNDQSFTQHTAATMGLDKPLLQAPDKYLSQAASDNATAEQSTYVCFFGGRENWTVAQFTMLLDPNVNNPAYNLNSYQIQISGLVKSTVQLTGSFDFKTNNTDFSYAGPTITPKPSTVSGAGPSASDFLVNPQKFLGSLATVADKFTDINDKADKTFKSISATTGPLADLRNVSGQIKSLTDNGVLKSVTAIAGQLGGLFGLAGSIIGLFTSDDSHTGTAFVPTISKGSIKMDGTITTQTPLHTFFLLTPGSNHYAANSGSTATPQALRSELPYYNCPLGIFNIRNTPLLQKVDYQRQTSETFYTYQWDENYTTLSLNPLVPGTGNDYNWPGGITPYTSYALSNDIKPIVNASSGLEISSVKIAIAQKVPLSSLYYGTVNADITQPDRPSETQQTYNYLYAQVASGMLEAYPYDPGTAGDGSDAKIILQTPFMDAACLSTKSLMPFNVPTPTADNPVYLRVIATLHKVNTPADSAPVYFAQDYAVDITTSGAQAYGGVNAPSPFNANYFTGYTAPASPYIYDVVKTGYLPYNDYNATSEIANNTLLFDQGSSVAVSGTYNLSWPIIFHASKSVGIIGELAVTPGTNFAITTDFASVAPIGSYSCGPGPLTYDATNLPCSYDTQALRIAGPLATTEATATKSLLTVAPNPATTNALAQLTVEGSECIQRVDLLNVEGQVVWQKELGCIRILSAEIPLSHLPTGLYVIRATTSTRVYASKLVVQ